VTQGQLRVEDEQWTVHRRLVNNSFPSERQLADTQSGLGCSLIDSEAAELYDSLWVVKRIIHSALTKLLSGLKSSF